jgi:citrate/tricarballylate utilization protein
VPLADPQAEGARILTICNACRYCEGYCAVFPAVEQRREFSPADLDYLANLCHNCAECYYACQYAPPHEFAVNVPKTLAEVRGQSYRRYAWGGRSLTVAVRIMPLLALPFLRRGTPGDFYSVLPHAAMVAVFGVASVVVLVALIAGAVRFWREMEKPEILSYTAARDILTLKYLASGGAGCTYPDSTHSMARRFFHHLTFYGFLLCFGSTTVAAFYHFALGLRAPYAWQSPPVLLGVLGGLGLLVGPPGLYRLKRRRDAAIADPNQDGMDITFLFLLFATSLTGFLLLIFRDSRVMPTLLLVHLAIVAALFATLPYGKFVHGIYRALALLRFAAEQRGSGEPHGAGER